MSTRRRKDHPAFSDRVRLRRAHHKAAYDFETIAAILDAQPLAHLGVLMDGWPAVFPTMHWREGRHVYIHGSRAGRKMKVAAGRPCCLTVSILDAWKLARSAFHHSVNFRSVMLYARPRLVPDDEKEARLNAMIETYFPGRSELLRPMTETELTATTVLKFPLEEASAKVGSGPVSDDKEDLSLAVWAGIIPVRTEAEEPQPDAHNPPELAIPDHVIPTYLRRRMEAG